MLSALKVFCARRHKFPSHALMGISLLPSRGVKRRPCDWCWTKLGWRGWPSHWPVAVPLPWWRGKSCLSSWIFLTCHPRGGNPTVVPWRGHGQPSAGRTALLCQTILNTEGWRLIREEKTYPLQPPPSPARRRGAAGRCWQCRAGADIGTSGFGGFGAVLVTLQLQPR